MCLKERVGGWEAVPGEERMVAGVDSRLNVRAELEGVDGSGALAALPLSRAKESSFEGLWVLPESGGRRQEGSGGTVSWKQECPRIEGRNTALKQLVPGSAAVSVTSSRPAVLTPCAPEPKSLTKASFCVVGRPSAA